MCLEGDSLKKKEYIKVKNENKQLNNAKRQTNYLVCNIEKGAVPLCTRKSQLPAEYRPHKLSGKYKGCWECHIQAD